MKNNAMTQLVKLLLDKTKKKKAIWQESSIGNAFCLNIASCIVEVKKWDCYHVETLVEVVLYNDNGEIIDDIGGSSIENKETFGLIDEFYCEARKSYYEYEKLMDGLIDELSKDGIIGKTENESGNG